MRSLTPQRRHGSLEQSDPRGGLPAELALRFGADRVHARLRWPQPLAEPEPAPLILLLADPSDPNEADVLSGMLCSAATAVVLTITPSGATSDADGPGPSLEVAALRWAAEHAGDLSANPARLSIAGLRAGGGHAAWLAINARDDTWPHLCRQLLVHPTFATPGGMPSHVAGVAPAMIAGPGAPNTDGRRYAARLRSAGIGVEELRCAGHDLPAGHQLVNFVRLLGTHSPARAPEPTPRIQRRRGRSGWQP
jgi:alpha/beta hydrolase fold